MKITSFGERPIYHLKEPLRHQGHMKEKAVFLHVQVKYISTNEPLLGCGSLPDWLRKKRCIYAVDGKEERTDNLCVWRCLAVYMRREVPRGTNF